MAGNSRKEQTSSLYYCGQCSFGHPLSNSTWSHAFATHAQMQLDIKRYHTLKPQGCLLCNDEVVYHSNKELQLYQRLVHQGILEQRCPIGWQRGVFITNEAVYVPWKSPSTADDFYTLPRPSPPYTPERWWWTETSCPGWLSHGKYFPLMPDWWMCRSE